MSRTESTEAKKLWDENDMLDDAEFGGLKLLRDMISPYWSSRVATDHRTGKEFVIVEGIRKPREVRP